MPHFAASHLGLHCLLRPLAKYVQLSITYGKNHAQIGKIMTKSSTITTIIDHNGRTDNQLSFQL